MKKWLLMTSILWLFQLQEPQMTVVEDTLIIEVSDAFMGMLYHDTELVEVLEDEDVKSLFQSQQMTNLSDNSFAVMQNIKETEII